MRTWLLSPVLPFAGKMDVQLEFKVFLCVCVYVFLLQGASVDKLVGTTNEINAIRTDGKNELFQSLRLSNLHCKDKDSIKYKI
jgi:hypothetical protein